jgi:hypothetical protein
VSPVPTADRAAEYLAKGSEVVLRAVGLGTEHRQARLLRSPQGNGRKVTFLTPRSWAYHVQVEAVLAHALRLRGASVEFLTCGGGLEICDRTNTWEAPPPPCRECRSYVHAALDAHDLPWSPVVPAGGGQEPWPELDACSVGDLADLWADGLPLGRLIEVPLRWFLMDSRVQGDPLAPQTARRFLRAARVVARNLRAALERSQPDVLFLLNGRFFFEAIAMQLAEEMGIEVISYERGFRPGSLFVRRDDPACFYDVGPDVWARAADVPLTATEDEAVDAYLGDRRAGRTGWWSYWDDPDRTVPERTAGVRRVGVFTNLTWDSAVIGRGRALPTIQDWLTLIVEAAASRAPHQFAIRVHPAERRLAGKQTREPVGPFLRERFPRLPPNVDIIDADDPLSSYALMESIDIGMVFTSTTGLELALAGLPTIVAGAPHYAGRGFTIDPASPGELLAALDKALATPEDHAADVERARRYAHLTWFRASIPFPFVVEPVRGLTRLTIDDVSALAPGRSDDLDVICAGVLGTSDFIRG